ncbi:MAG: glycosyltransferase family 4 protein [Hydrogenothermaceae bacterium]|nr:glycosyltransferase family 4 protein [Hydrogenothermaceae bacterium]
MKILHLIYDHVNNPWVGGGGAVRVYEIYKRLSERGHVITVISGNYPGAKDYKVNDNFEYKFVGSQKNYIISTFSYAFYTNRLLKDIHKNYDVIVEDFAPWNPIFSYKFEEYTKVILQIQLYAGLEILKKYNIIGVPFFLIEKFYPKRFKNIIVVNEVLNKKFNINGYVIPNGVDFTVENNAVFDGKYLGYLGRVDIIQKGLDIAVNSMKNIPDVDFIVAGNGKDKDKFIKLIKNIPNIKYVGKLSGEDKINFIKNTKFLLIPSRFEGQGIVALEAAAMGKPVIVSDIPELKYVVENGFGISFKSGDSVDLKRKILFLLEQPELIKEMGKKGIEFAKNFTWDKISKIYENYLLTVLQK